MRGPVHVCVRIFRVAGVVCAHRRLLEPRDCQWLLWQRTPPPARQSSVHPVPLFQTSLQPPTTSLTSHECNPHPPNASSCPATVLIVARVYRCPCTTGAAAVQPRRREAGHPERRVLRRAQHRAPGGGQQGGAPARPRGAEHPLCSCAGPWWADEQGKGRQVEVSGGSGETRRGLGRNEEWLCRQTHEGQGGSTSCPFLTTLSHPPPSCPSRPATTTSTQQLQ